VLHVFDIVRPGQARGISWLAAAVLKMSDFDEYEDALLTRQKVAACFTAFVTDTEGDAAPLGDDSQGNDKINGIERLEPGLIQYLKPGQNIEVAAPPAIPDNDTFSRTQLRGIAAALGVTYEDLTGDYSQSNFSSSRMSRQAHWLNVQNWQNNMLIPRMMQPIWDWFEEICRVRYDVDGDPDESPTWIVPAMPMIDPEKEGKALKGLVRSGAKTLHQMIAEQGRDPEEHLAEYAEGLKILDALEITLDSDPRKVTDQGIAQMEPAQSS
jgi:lambda family phage portal protein